MNAPQTMSHPFIDGKQLDELNADELQTKIAELNKKLATASRMNNGYLVSQIRMALHSYQEAHGKKIQAQYQKLNLNSKIDINNSAKVENKNTAIDTFPLDNLPPYL